MTSTLLPLLLQQQIREKAIEHISEELDDLGMKHDYSENPTLDFRAWGLANFLVEYGEWVARLALQSSHEEKAKLELSCLMCGHAKEPSTYSATKGCFICVDCVAQRNGYIEMVNLAASERGRAIQADAALSRLTQAHAWQPMATAPKDGTVIRVYDVNLVDEDFNVTGTTESYWQDTEGWKGALWDAENDSWYAEVIQPTHWMPLPSPPQEPT